MFLNFEGRGTGTGYARTAPQAGTRQGQGHLIDARGTLHAAYRDAPGTHASGTLRATRSEATWTMQGRSMYVFHLAI